jgi:hypothetical protein
MKQELQQHKLSAPNLNWPGLSASEPVMVSCFPVEDAGEQLKLQLQMVQSRLMSDSASVILHVFESYDDTYKWVVSKYSPED